MVSATAAADGVSDERELYERGATAYGLQHWDDALEAFQAAYGARRDATLLFNIAQCQRQLGQYEAAAKSYRLYLANDPDGANRELAARLAEQMAVAARRSAAPPAPPPVAASSIGANAVAASPPAPVRALHRSPRHRVIGLVVGSIGLATAIGGAALLGRGAVFDSDARTATTLAEQRQEWLSGGTYQTAGIAVISIGGAEAIAAAVLLAVR